MMDATTLIKNMSSNNIRALQAESEGNDRDELRHLLFAAEDISKLLRMWRFAQQNESMAMTYSKSLHHTTARIEELIDKGAIKR